MKMKITNIKDNKTLIKIIAVLIWILIWQIASIIIGSSILLASPLEVLEKLGELIVTSSFWQSVGYSFFRIVAGFLAGNVLGVVCAALAYRFKVFEIFLWPVVAVIKTAPVVSFIILFLIWITSKNLSIVISFLMVFPIVYTNVLRGLINTDRKLLQMADVFKVNTIKRFIYIYLSSVFPFYVSACQVALGLCWKAGITAELIGIPTGSIGDKLYKAKLYLDTAELFAWTIVIIVVSILFEKLFMYILKKGVEYVES